MFFVFGGEQGIRWALPIVCYANPDCVRLRRGGSNPSYISLQKTKEHYLAIMFFVFGGEQGIRTLETVLAVYTISNRAPSTSSDNSPSVQSKKIFDPYVTDFDIITKYI